MFRRPDMGCSDVRRAWGLASSGAGQGGRAAAVAGHAFAVAAHLARTPAAAPAPRGVQVHQGAGVALAAAQPRAGGGVGQQVHRVPGEGGEQRGAGRRCPQRADEGAVGGAERVRGGGAGRAWALRWARAGSSAGVPPARRCASINRAVQSRSSRNGVSQVASTWARGVPGGTRGVVVIQSRRAAGVRRCSAGCAVARRSRQGRPASKRGSRRRRRWWTGACGVTALEGRSAPVLLQCPPGDGTGTPRGRAGIHLPAAPVPPRSLLSRPVSYGAQSLGVSRDRR